LKELIDAQISNEITISDLAAVAGLSQFHFIRAFKDSVGLSPYQYVLSERVRRARDLLLNFDLSIAEVALAVGFSDAIPIEPGISKICGRHANRFPTGNWFEFAHKVASDLINFGLSFRPSGR
jgi:AraC family transcriptional regulator